VSDRHTHGAVDQGDHGDGPAGLIPASPWTSLNRDTGAFELPEDELGAFIAHRMEMVRIGDATPIDINLRNGEVLRFVCTALPDGGRMLSYTPVTDLVRHTDAPARADY
jgi:hypothetical protein